MFLLIFVICLTNNLLSQSFDCYKSDSILTKDVIVAYNDFVSRFNVRSSIVLIDYTNNDTISLMRIVNSQEFYEILYKRPDCFFKSDSNIAYLHTKLYKNFKDTIWLNNIFQESLKILPSIHDVKISWKDNSILFLESEIKVSTYDPAIVEYKIRNGIILNRVFSKKMIFPDSNRLPKNNFYRCYDGIFNPPTR
jgi:hypothetical protein